MPWQSAAPMAIIAGAYTALSYGSALLIQLYHDGQKKPTNLSRYDRLVYFREAKRVPEARAAAAAASYDNADAVPQA